MRPLGGQDRTDRFNLVAQQDEPERSRSCLPGAESGGGGRRALASLVKMSLHILFSKAQECSCRCRGHPQTPAGQEAGRNTGRMKLGQGLEMGGFRETRSVLKHCVALASHLLAFQDLVHG